jgi:hypothetical protein
VSYLVALEKKEEKRKEAQTLKDVGKPNAQKCL